MQGTCDPRATKGLPKDWLQEGGAWQEAPSGLETGGMQVTELFPTGVTKAVAVRQAVQDVAPAYGHGHLQVRVRVRARYVVRVSQLQILCPMSSALQKLRFR